MAFPCPISSCSAVMLVADRLFSEAMDSVENLAGDSFATDLDWGRFGRPIDLGGSRGSKALTVLK